MQRYIQLLDSARRRMGGVLRVDSDNVRAQPHHHGAMLARRSKSADFGAMGKLTGFPCCTAALNHSRRAVTDPLVSRAVNTPERRYCYIRSYPVQTRGSPVRPATFMEQWTVFTTKDAAPYPLHQREPRGLRVARWTA